MSPRTDAACAWSLGCFHPGPLKSQLAIDWAFFRPPPSRPGEWGVGWSPTGAAGIWEERAPSLATSRRTQRRSPYSTLCEGPTLCRGLSSLPPCGPPSPVPPFSMAWETSATGHRTDTLQGRCPSQHWGIAPRTHFWPKFVPPTYYWISHDFKG